jgi:uncharacterized small protein (DUF1192 family)
MREERLGLWDGEVDRIRTKKEKKNNEKKTGTR